MPWFYRDFTRFFQKCTVILPIFYRDFLTALLIITVIVTANAGYLPFTIVHPSLRG